MNKGGFSWNRFLGITRLKQNIARKTGIPLTKSGRQRKIGAMLTGKGCVLVLLLGISAPFFFIYILIKII